MLPFYPVPIPMLNHREEEYLYPTWDVLGHCQLISQLLDFSLLCSNGVLLLCTTHRIFLRNASSRSHSNMSRCWSASSFPKITSSIAESPPPPSASKLHWLCGEALCRETQVGGQSGWGRAACTCRGGEGRRGGGTEGREEGEGRRDGGERMEGKGRGAREWEGMGVQCVMCNMLVHWSVWCL